jgi:hypothetical protein
LPGPQRIDDRDRSAELAEVVGGPSAERAGADYDDVRGFAGLRAEVLSTAPAGTAATFVRKLLRSRLMA